MKCKFSHLEFGDIVHLGGGTACCGGCGCDVESLIELNTWRYQAHSGNMDLFEPTKLLYCPVCGERILGYGERCGELGGLQIEISVSVDKLREIIKYSH